MCFLCVQDQRLIVCIGLGPWNFDRGERRRGETGCAKCAGFHWRGNCISCMFLSSHLYYTWHKANQVQGDIIFCDPLEGVVAIPRELLDQVLETMPKLVSMDDKVKDAVLQGSTVNDAFKKFRTKI